MRTAALEGDFKIKANKINLSKTERISQKAPVSWEETGRGRKVISRVNVTDILEDGTVREGQPPPQVSQADPAPPQLLPTPPVGRPLAGSLAAILDMEGPGDISLGATATLPWGDTSGGQSCPDTCQTESPPLLETSSSSVSLTCHASVGRDRQPIMMPGSPQWCASHHGLSEALDHPLEGHCVRLGRMVTGVLIHPANPDQKELWEEGVW